MLKKNIPGIEKTDSNKELANGVGIVKLDK